MPRVSVSSWSLHRRLGRAWHDPDGRGGFTNRSRDAPDILHLLDLPAEAAAHGIRTVELCHFHFPSTSPEYLARLRTGLAQSGVELFSVLIDGGDISAPDEAARDRDLAMVRGWVDVASTLGAGCVRIVAGEGPLAPDAVDRCVRQLCALAAYAADSGVRVLTENFRRLAARPEVCLQILDRCDGRVGLCADFGNFPAASRAADLAAVLPRADSIHAKADYPGGRIDAGAYRQLLRLALDAGFDGPASLIYQDDGDTWSRLRELKDLTEQRPWGSSSASTRDRSWLMRATR